MTTMLACERDALVKMLVSTVLERTNDFDAVELAEALDTSGELDPEYQKGLQDHYLKFVRDAEEE